MFEEDPCTFQILQGLNEKGALWIKVKGSLGVNVKFPHISQEETLNSPFPQCTLWSISEYLLCGVLTRVPPGGRVKEPKKLRFIGRQDDPVSGTACGFVAKPKSRSAQETKPKSGLSFERMV